MNSNYQAVIEFCDNEQIEYRCIEGKAIIHCGFKGENGCYDTIISTEDQNIEVQTFYPVKVPQRKASKVIELINLINQNLKMGHIICCDDIIVYRTNILFQDKGIPTEIVRHLIYANWVCTDRTYVAIESLLVWNNSPQEALEVLTDKGRNHPTTNNKAGRVDHHRNWGGRLGDIMNN